jgi:ABC-2 type transport system ATP-binding protein
MAAIAVRGLSRFYGDFVALRDVSFDVPEGQIVTLLGPNGAGKSTTLKILTGYLAPSAGSAAILGCDVQADRLGAAAAIGYLPENGPLYPDMTALETLSFFGEARGLPRELLDARIADVVTQCGLELILDIPAGKLSKGLRQRVGLAQALLHDPPVLILDEPTSGLDPNQIRDFRDHIRSLAGRKTILISTHILQEVEAIAERVLLISAGRLVFDGPPVEMKDGTSLEAAFHKLTTHQ